MAIRAVHAQALEFLSILLLACSARPIGTEIDPFRSSENRRDGEPSFSLTNAAFFPYSDYSIGVPKRARDTNRLFCEK